MPMSLSPRPLTLTITTSLFFILGARLITSATACADSRAGMIPSSRAKVWHAARASASDAQTYSARPASFNRGVLGTDGRIIQSGGDGVRQRDLSGFVLQNVGEGSLQYSGPAACESARRVRRARSTASAGFDADELDLLVGNEFDRRCRWRWSHRRRRR